MKASEELREKMWELCYDLLPDDERRALVATIKSDPQVARLYAEVRLQADLVGYASIVEDSSLILSPEGKKSPDSELAPAAGRSKEVLQPTPAAAKSHAKSAVTKSAAKSASSDFGKTSWVAWLPAAAALALFGLIGYGTLRPNIGPHQTAEALVTEVEVPGLVPAGVSQQVWVRSLRANGEPAPAELDVKLIAPDGEVRHHQIVQANEDGLAMVDLPGQAVSRGVRIEAAARSESLARDHYERSAGEASDSMSVVSAPLPVATEPPLTYFLQESPDPQPGEPTRYAKYSLSRFGFEMQPADGWETFQEASQPERAVKQLGERDSSTDGTTAAELATGAAPAGGMASSGPTTRMKRSLADGVVEWKDEGDAKSLESKLALETRDARLPEALSLKQESATLADQADPSKPNPSRPNASKPSADRPNLNPAAGLGARVGTDRTYAEGIEKQSDASKLARNYYRQGARRNYSARRNVQQLDSLASSTSGKLPATKDSQEREALSEPETAKGAEIAAKQGADDFESKKALSMQRFAEASEATKAKETKEEDKGFSGALTQVDSPAPAPAEKTAPAGKPQSGFAFFDAMRGEPSVVAAGAPVTIAVPSELAEKKLLLEAVCRNVTVATASMNAVAMNPAKKDQSEKAQIALEGKPGGEPQLAKDEAEAAHDEQGSTWEFALQLPPEVDGDVEVRLIDTSLSPPQVVARQWFYRQPAKELKLALVAVNGLAEAKNEFKPGEKVSLRFRVLSEHDQPEAALLPVRVWREDAIEASGQEPEMLADFVRSQAALVATGDFGNSAARGLSRLRGFDDSLNRALAMQSAQQPMDLKKADGVAPKVRAMAPATAPPLAATVPGASPEATTPAPAEAPALARSDAQPPAPAAPAPAPAPVTVDPAAALPAAPAAESPPTTEAAIAESSSGGSTAGNLAYGVSGMPAESATTFAGVSDLFAESSVAQPVQPQVVSNWHEITRQRELATRESAAAWEAWRAVVGRVLVIGGLAALAGLFVLFLIRTPVRAGSGTLALVGGVASLLVGAFWIADGRQEMQIALAPAESAPLAMSPAPGSASRELDEAVEISGQGLGGGGGEAMRTFGSTRAMDDLPAPMSVAAPTNDESQQQNAAGSALGGAPAGPDSAAPDRNTVNDADRFRKEANKEAEAASKSSEGFGGFGGGRSSRGAGMGGGTGGARGSLRTKVPAPADAVMEKTTTDQAAGAKAAGEQAAGDRKSEDKQASEGARPADAAENRGGKIASPPAQPRLAAEMPKAAAANAPGGGGRPVGDAGVPSDDFPLPPAPAPGIAGQQPRASEGEETVGRRQRGGVSDAPVTLYFNPRLETDADGYATIELQMPNAEADYRILIDAIGHGRIGSAEMLIMCRK